MSKHRQKTRQSPQTQLLGLSSNQQGVVNLLVRERQQEEQQNHVEWVLADLQCEHKGFFSSEVKKLQVILKRQEKSSKDRNTGDKAKQKSRLKQQPDTRDLSELAQEEQKSSNARELRRARSRDDLMALNERNLLAPPPPRPFAQTQFDFDGVPAPPPPPQSFLRPPDDTYSTLPPSFAPPPPFQPHNPFEDLNPFSPLGQPASSSPWDPDFDYRRRNPSRRRPRLSSRRSREADERAASDRFASLSDRRDTGEDHSDISSEAESIFSRRRDSRRTDTTSRSSMFSDAGTSRSRYSSFRSSYRSSFRSTGYDDETLPQRRSDRRYYQSPRRRSRTRLNHATTYDDYPTRRAAELRFPSPLPQRPLSAYGDDSYDYEDYARRPRHRYDTLEEADEQWRWRPIVNVYNDGDDAGHDKSWRRPRSSSLDAKAHALPKMLHPPSEIEPTQDEVYQSLSKLNLASKPNERISTQSCIDDLDALLNPEEYFQALDDLEFEIIDRCRISDLFSIAPITSPAQVRPRYDQSSTLIPRPESKASLDALCDAVLTSIALLEHAKFSPDSVIFLVEDSEREAVIKAVAVNFEEIRTTVDRIKKSNSEHSQPGMYFETSDGWFRLFGIDRERWPASEAPFALCSLILLGILSYVGSHCSPLVETLWPGAAGFVSFGPTHPGSKSWLSPYLFRRQSLRCLDSFIGSPVWVFGRSESLEAASLSISLMQFNDLWGPTYAIPNGESFDELIALKVEGGLIYRIANPPTPLKSRVHGETLMHFMSLGNVTKEILFDDTCSDNLVFSHDAEEQLPDPFIPFPASSQLLIGYPTESITCTAVNDTAKPEPAGSRWCTTQAHSQLTLNEDCESSSNSFGRRNTHRFHQMGTHRAHYVPQQLQLNFAAGQYVTGGVGKVWKRRPQSTYKERLLEYCSTPSNPEAHMDPILQLRVGLEVSMCTGNARRISLWDALVLSNRRGLCTLQNAYKAGDLFTLSTYMTRISKTGFNEVDRLQLFWPFEHGLPHVVDVSDSMPTWSRILKDTETSACFATLSSRCMIFEDQDRLAQPHRAVLQRCHGRIEKYVGSVLETIVNLHPHSHPRKLPLSIGTRMRLQEGFLEMRNKALAFHEEGTRLSRFNKRKHLVHDELLDANRASDYTLPVCIMEDPRSLNGSVALRLG